MSIQMQTSNADGTGVMVGVGLLDVITFDVLKSAFTNLTEEMALTVRRAAYSTNIKTRADFSCAFFDNKLRAIALSFAQPPHLVSMANVLPTAIEEYGADRLQPGDCLLVNDPHRGASHLNDIACISPVFSGGKCIGYVANMAHHVDVGGSFPASLGLAKDIYQEGIVLPPTRIARGGDIDENVLNFFLANVRAPRETSGDLRAQIAANTGGTTHAQRIIERYSQEVVTAFFDELVSYTRRWTERELSDMKNGTWSAIGYRDDDGITDEPVKIQVNVTIQDKKMILDVTGSDPQTQSSLNATRQMTMCSLAFVARSLMDAKLPVNSGFLDCLEVTGPDGLVCTAMKPAGVVGGWEVGQLTTELIWKALFGAFPERVPAASKGLIVNIGLAGHDPKKAEYFCYMETIGGGGGARSSLDGADAVQTSLHNTENAPVEEIELNYPFRIQRYELIKDSCGNGKFRGGLGIRRVFEFPYAPIEFTILSDGTRFAPWGLAGGGSARPARFIRTVDGQNSVLPSKTTFTAGVGETVSIETPGGGGYGDPGERLPEQVSADIRAERVSVPKTAKPVN